MLLSLEKDTFHHLLISDLFKCVWYWGALSLSPASSLTQQCFLHCQRHTSSSWPHDKGTVSPELNHLMILLVNLVNSILFQDFFSCDFFIKKRLQLFSSDILHLFLFAAARCRVRIPNRPHQYTSRTILWPSYNTLHDCLISYLKQINRCTL